MAKTKEVVVEVVESDAKVAFRKLVEVYKASSPAKYELRKDELEAKLNSL